MRARQVKSRKLRVLKGARLPRAWLLVDTETRTVVTHYTSYERFRLGWVCTLLTDAEGRESSSDWRLFISEIEFNKHLEAMAHRYGKVYLLGHNVFFDLQAAGFFEYFRRWGWRLEFLYDLGLTYILKITRGSEELTVLSTTNWFDCSLKKLGELVGLKKMDIDLKAAPMGRVRDYCRRDVEILVKALLHYLRFIKDNDLGSFSLTKASQAFTAYRHRFMGAEIYMHSEADIIELERSAYFGGRVECFRLGRLDAGPYVSLDVNSMYPYVMKEYEYPCRLVDYDENYNTGGLSKLLERYCIVAEVELNTDDNAYACRQGKTIIFPTGRFRAFLCSGGLARALSRGEVAKVLRVAFYAKGDLFSSYVDGIAALRDGYERKGDKIMVKLCKYMHNSLYGKFAQKGTVCEVREAVGGPRYLREEILDRRTHSAVIKTTVMNKVMLQYAEGEGKNTLVAISAHVAEHARMALHRIMEGVGKQRVLYCDTDAIKIREADMKYVKWDMDETRLGSLKVESRCSVLQIDGAKNYRMDGERSIKGIPVSAVEVSPGHFYFTRFERQAFHLTKSQIVGARVGVASRSLHHIYDKGVVGADGRVTPFRLGEGELPF